MRPQRPHTAKRFGTRTATTLLVTALAAATPFPAAAAAGPTERLSTLVDPLIGSANGGNTYSGATRPYGMIAWSPTSTTGDQTSTGAANGYQYDTTRIRGLSLTHVNGAGCNPGAAGDVPVMPFVGDVTSSPSADTKDAVYAADFSHADEKAVPGRYTLGLKSGATADLAVSERAGVADFTFPSGKPANLLFRVSNSLNGSADAHVDIDEDRRKVTGWVLTGAFCGRRANGGVNNRKSYYKLYFSASFDRAFSSVGTWKDGMLSPGATTASGGEGYATGADRAGRGSGGWVGFDTSADTSSDNDVHMRLGISYVSLDGAEANLRHEIRPRASVADVAAAGARAWDRELSSVRVEGGSDARRRTFYTALYHSLMQPNLISDVDGRYWGMDQAVHRLARGQRAQYSNFSGWDQYRAQIQLLALLKPTVAGDFAQSLYNFARQNGGVWDRWVHVSGATHVMTGDPSAATLATFYAMGVRNFDYEGAFDSLVRQATVPHPDGLSDAGCPGQCVGQRPNLAQYLSSHYAAQDVCHCWGGSAETLEDAVADSALGKWAELLGRDEEAKVFTERGAYWRNVFNPDTGYIQARKLDGSWVTPFNPASDLGFAQGTSATYTWMVPQDVQGLATAMGGRDLAATRLDGFFHKADGSWSVRGGDALRYDPTNEPGIHAPWLYNALGQPWKTQATVRQIVDTVYGTGPSGLPGNDDLGTMSAWYVFSALGLYPQVPGSASLLLGAPVFPAVTIDRPGRSDLTISAPDADDTHVYVDAVRLNGRPYQRSWADGLIRTGGTLVFRLAEQPNTGWATDPASLPK